MIICGFFLEIVGFFQELFWTDAGMLEDYWKLAAVLLECFIWRIVVEGILCLKIVAGVLLDCLIAIV